MKKITVLFTVLMMLAASSAWAVDATFPSSLNGSTAQFMTGFNINASASASYSTTLPDHNASFTVFNSTGLVAYTPQLAAVAGATSPAKSSTNASFYGNIGWNNSTTDTYTVFNQSNSTIGNQSMIRVNQPYQGVQGLIAVGQVNGTYEDSVGGGALLTTPYYFISTGSQSLMAGLNNSTYQRIGTTAGANFALVYNASTFADVYSTSDTWDMYGVGMDFDDDTPYYIIGQLQMTTAPGSSNNAKAKYVAYGYDGSTYDKSADWYNYNATDGNAHAKLTLKRDDNLTLVENATINSDKNFFSGYTSESSYKHFVVFVKNGVTLSTTDVKDRAFKMVYAGFGSGSRYSRNATAGIVSMQVNSAMRLSGSTSYHSGGEAAYDESVADLEGFTVEVADTDYFKSITQSNMTITSSDGSTLASTFFGKQSADKTYAAGIYRNNRGGVVADFNLIVMIPDSAVVGTLTSAGSNFQNNGTIGAYTFRYNNTAYSSAELKSLWPTLPTNFVPLTGAIGFNSTSTAGVSNQRGDIYYTFQIPFSGLGNKISTLDLMKIFPTADKTVRSYSYSSEPTTTTDGSWWISTEADGGYIGAESELIPANTYYINYVLKDNGLYDYRIEETEFGDPVLLGTSPASSSSSSSSGCVFNPAAGFGLEWLLLMLAPMVAIVRSRFKK